MLLYAKNGHRPQLLEHLAEVVPRHIQIHYGRYRREELFEAARRSRACAYLADDDHGPLALQEILLAGCPTVGVRTGASFVQHGETGEFQRVELSEVAASIRERPVDCWRWTKRWRNWKG